MTKTNPNSKLKMANATIARAKNFDPESVKLMLEQGFKEEYLNEVAESQEKGVRSEEDRIKIFNNASATAALKIREALDSLRVYSGKQSGEFFGEFIDSYNMITPLFEEYDAKTLAQAKDLASANPKQDTLQSYVERIAEACEIKHNLTETGKESNLNPESQLNSGIKLINLMNPSSQTPGNKGVGDQGPVAGEDVIAKVALEMIRKMRELITLEMQQEMSKVLLEAQTSQPTNGSPDWHGKETADQKDMKVSWVERLGVDNIITKTKGGVGETQF